MEATQQQEMYNNQVEYCANQIRICRDKVSNLLMPIRYFGTLNILP